MKNTQKNTRCFRKFLAVTLTGVSTPVYGTCSIVIYQYRGLLQCACGATNGLAYDTKTVHTKCGQ